MTTIAQEEVKLSHQVCVECKDKPARHWNSSFCEDCFSEILSEKLKNE